MANIFSRFFNRQVQRALQNINRDNQMYRGLYGFNSSGVYEPLGNPDDGLDYGYNVNTTIYSIVRRVTRADAKITFTAPPSGNVEIEGEQSFWRWCTGLSYLQGTHTFMLQ